MAHMVYSTLLTSTVRSERQECPPHLTSRHIYKCATHSVRAWPGGVVAGEDGREGRGDHADSLWGSSLVRSSPGHRGVERPTSETRDPGGKRGVSWEVLLGQSVKESGCQGSSHGHHGWTAWRFETTCLHGSHSGHDSAAHHPLHLASLCTIEPNWQTPQKPMEDWVAKSANCRHSSEF